MSLMTALFGGTTLKQMPGAQDYIDSMKNYGENVGLGASGKLGKHIMKSFSNGNYESDPTITPS